MTVLTLTDIPYWPSALTWPYHKMMLPTAFGGWGGVGLVGDGEISDVWLRFASGMARLHNTELFAIWYRSRLVSRPRGSCDL